MYFQLTSMFFQQFSAMSYLRFWIERTCFSGYIACTLPYICYLKCCDIGLPPLCRHLFISLLESTWMFSLYIFCWVRKHVFHHCIFYFLAIQVCVLYQFYLYLHIYLCNSFFDYLSTFGKCNSYLVLSLVSVLVFMYFLPCL